jgi:hypothetical protein
MMDQPPPAPVALPVPDDNPLSSPLGIGDVLDGAFRLYRANFGPLLLSAAVLLAPIGILSAIAVGPMQGAQFQVYRAMFSGSDAFDPALLGDAQDVPAMLAVCLLAPLQIVLKLVVELALMQQVVDALRGRSRTMGERFRQALNRLPGYAAMGCMVWILMGTVVVGLGLAFAVGFGALLAAVAAAGAGTAGAVTASVVVVGGIVLGMGGVAGAVLYAAPAPQPVAALDTSWQLTRRRPWRAMAFATLLFLLGGILSLIVATPLMGVALFLPPSAATAAGILTQSLGVVVQLLLMPFQAAAVVVFYYDLRLRAQRPS